MSIRIKIAKWFLLLGALGSLLAFFLSPDLPYSTALSYAVYGISFVLYMTSCIGLHLKVSWGRKVSIATFIIGIFYCVYSMIYHLRCIDGWNINFNLMIVNIVYIIINGYFVYYLSQKEAKILF